jgi:hypothetical protein
MQAAKIVAKLLEADEEMTPGLAQHYVDLIGNKAAADRAAEETRIRILFQNQALGYMRWITDNQADKEDVRAVLSANTFAEIEAVLAKYDDPKISFLSMVREGYWS